MTRSTSPRFAALLLATLSACTGLPLLNGNEPETIFAKVTDLEAKVGTFYVIQELKLSRNQATQLLELLDEAEKVIADSNDKLTELLKGIGAHRARIEAAIANDWPPDDVAKASDRLQYEVLFVLGRKLAEDIAPLAERVLPVLDRRQVATLDTLARMKDLPGLDRALGGGWSLHQEGGDEKEKTQTDIVNSWAAAYGAWTTAGRLLVAPYARQAVQTLVLQAKGGRSVAGERSGTNDAVIARFRDPATMHEFYSLGSKIASLNLVAGMVFTPDQSREIIELLQKDLLETGRCRPETYTFATREGERYARELGKAAKYLERGRSLSEKKLRSLAQLRQEARQEEIPKGALKDAMRRSAVTQKLTSRIQRILTSRQQGLMLTYIPCVFVPSALKGGPRVGQVARKTDWIGKMIFDSLNKARAMSDANWDANGDDIIDAMLKRTIPPGTVSEQRRQGYRARIVKVFEEGRRMTDTEYGLNKDRMYEDLSFLYVEVEAVKKLAELEGEGRLPKAIEAHIVNSRMLAILEAKQAAQTKR